MMNQTECLTVNTCYNLGATLEALNKTFHIWNKIPDEFKGAKKGKKIRIPSINGSLTEDYEVLKINGDGSVVITYESYGCKETVNYQI